MLGMIRKSNQYIISIFYIKKKQQNRKRLKCIESLGFLCTFVLLCIITFFRSTTGSRNLSKISLRLSIYTSFSWQFTKYLHSIQPLSFLFWRKIKSICFPTHKFCSVEDQLGNHSILTIVLISRLVWMQAQVNSFTWDTHQGHSLCRRDVIRTHVQNWTQA